VYAIISLSYTQISLLKHYVLPGTVRYDKSRERQVQTVAKERTTVLITAQSTVTRRSFAMLSVALRTPVIWMNHETKWKVLVTAVDYFVCCRCGGGMWWHFLEDRRRKCSERKKK